MLQLFRARFSVILGVFFVVLSVIFSIWTPFYILMNERLEMRKGLPPFELWTKPPDVTLKVFLFNVTNSKDFLNGVDKKMRIQEIGPIVFKESWLHSNVTFNENSTITYNVRKTPVYDPDLNKLDLDDLVTIPNMALLASASFFSNMPLFVKYIFRSTITLLRTKPFVTLTIREILYNNTDPLLKFANNYIPALAPVKNLGILDNLYDIYGDNVTAFMGNSRGHSVFSLIDVYNGVRGIPGYENSCKDRITNASEAVMFNQFISKGQVLKYYRKMLCRVVSLIYAEEAKRYGLTGYKFIIPEEVFNRTLPEEDDCYKGVPTLLDGLSDISRCLHSFPFVVSFPHFLFGDEKLRSQVEGIKPNASIHRSYILVEPTTGIPMEEKALIQLNVHVKPLEGFDRTLSEKFSDSIVPIFWLEFSMMNLPYNVLSLIYLVVILKYLQWIIVGILLFFGLKWIKRGFYREVIEKKLAENESFLMKNIDVQRRGN